MKFTAYDIGCAVLAAAILCAPAVVVAAGIVMLIPHASADTAIFYTTNETDGFVARTVNGTFLQVRNGAGNSYSLSDQIYTTSQILSNDVDWASIIRIAYVFDTSVTPDTAAISGATFGFYSHSATIEYGGTFGVTKFNIDGTISAEDYDNFDYDRFNTGAPGTSGQQNLALNSLGIQNISKTGSTGYGILSSWDIDNTTPSWASTKRDRLRVRVAEYILNTPYLEITYTVPDTTPPDSITGLTNTSVSCNQHFFNWTNPLDADYAGMMLYRNNTQLADLTASDTGVSWDGLPGGTAITFSSRTFDSEGNVNATWANMTTTTASCASPTPTPTPSWQSCFQWCGIQEIFFWNASSDISGYRVMDHIPEISAEREVNVSVSSATGSKTIGSWASPSGSPGVTTIAPGLWRFRTYHSVSSQVGVTTLEFKVFNRSSDGTETDLFYGHAITEEINALDPTEYLLSYARRNATTLFPGDRLVIKVNASTSSVSARNVYMWLAGNTNTSMVQVSNFICCSGSSGCGVMVANELPIPFYIPLIAAGLSILAWRRKSRM